MAWMRVIAILGVYNEERFIHTCLRHLIDQGMEVYLIAVKRVAPRGYAGWH